MQMRIKVLVRASNLCVLNKMDENRKLTSLFVR